MCVWPICIYLSVNLSVNSSVIQAMNHSSATIPFGQSGRIKSTWDLDCSNPKKDRNIYMCVWLLFWSDCPFLPLGLLQQIPSHSFGITWVAWDLPFWFPQLWPQEGHSWYALRGRALNPWWNGITLGWDFSMNPTGWAKGWCERWWWAHENIHEYYSIL